MSKVFRYDSVKNEEVTTEGANKTKIRWLITKEMGATNFAMRVFEVEADGYTPLHTHPWEHEIFILEGEGQLFDGEKITPFKAQDAIFVPPNQRHQFKNSSQTTLKFICLVPYTKE
jgi:quercetin dioxygenase-like cupin family protein